LGVNVLKPLHGPETFHGAASLRVDDWDVWLKNMDQGKLIGPDDHQQFGAREGSATSGTQAA
jgi:hypothetical protein